MLVHSYIFIYYYIFIGMITGIDYVMASNHYLADKIKSFKNTKEKAF